MYNSPCFVSVYPTTQLIPQRQSRSTPLLNRRNPLFCNNDDDDDDEDDDDEDEDNDDEAEEEDGKMRKGKWGYRFI